MDLVFAILGIILIVVGFLGTFVPVIPGAPLAWIGFILGKFSSYINFPAWILVVTGIIAAAVSIIDNFFPVWMTKHSGGSTAGTTGSTIGLVVGLFTGPWGIILGPFCGALVGELIHDHSDFRRCLKAAFGAFKGFLFGTGMKMIVVAAYAWVYIVYWVK